MDLPELVTNVVLVILGGGLTIVTTLVNGKVELRKRRPETVTHHCRLAKLDVYTFIKVDKEQTPPLCPYLDPSDYITCQFSPDHDRPNALEMKEVNQGQCYIAHFTNTFDLM